MFFINESPSIQSIPKNIKKVNKKGTIRMECVLQTVGDVNRNKRRYSRELVQEAISSDNVRSRLADGSLLGELDHPLDDSAQRQMQVLFKEVSHIIREVSWDGNKLIGIVETLRSPNGTILKNFCEDGLPVGFSFRGMGDIKEIFENGTTVFEVVGPVQMVTYDAVSFPSHSEAKVRKITESFYKSLNESVNLMKRKEKVKHEKNGMICTESGICYIPNDFDRLVERRIIDLENKFEI